MNLVQTNTKSRKSRSGLTTSFLHSSIHLFMFMSVLPISMSMPKEARRGHQIGSARTAVTDGCELANGCWEFRYHEVQILSLSPELSLLRESPVPLTCSVFI